MSEVLVLLTTFPSVERAAEVAEALVGERLAACVNLLPGATSIYRWRGAVARDAEVVAIIKTTPARYPALAERFTALHPYEVPELLALEAGGLPGYLAWVAAETTPTPG